MSKIDFSFIIPVKDLNDYVYENVEKIQNLTGGIWDIWIVTDFQSVSTWEDYPNIHVIDSGPVGPAAKRDLAAHQTSASNLIFIDDDSFPDSKLLIELDRLLKRKEIVAIGGPGQTPKNDSFWQKVSGATFETPYLSSDPHRYRPIGKERFVDDWPSVNLCIRKEVFLEIGGFDSNYWPGEDTEFCLKLVQNGHKILYSPTVLVFHHRRTGIGRHLKQVGGYGLHRGYFAKKFPQNSRKIKYFIPSAFSVYLILLILTFFSKLPNIIWVPLILYTFTLIFYILSTTKRHSLFIAIASVPFLVLSHFWYGVRFFYGFALVSELKSRLRK